MPPECWKQQLQQVRAGWVLAAVGLVRLFGALGLAPDIEGLVTKFPPDVQPIVRTSYYRERFFRTLSAELANYEESTAQLRAATRPLGGKPLAVLTAGAYEYPSYCRVTQDQKDELNQLWMDRHRELASLSSNSTHIVAEKSGHRIHLDQPALVVDAIRKVVEEARR
jgi:pimeloyl-ACP methyl ester carboxylesterase